MAKRLLAFLSISIFLAGLLAAQTDGGKSAAQESLPKEKAAPSLKEKVKEVTEGVQEYKDKIAKEEEKRPVKALQFLGDFFTDKLPLTLDFGAEPGEKENTIFAVIQYDWNKNFSSRLRFENKNVTDISDRYGGYEKTTDKSFAFYLLPAVWYFGDDDVDSQEALWSFGLGAFYSFSKQGSRIYATQGALWADYDIKTNYHSVGPLINATVKKPLGQFFDFGAEILILPIYGIFANSQIDGKVYGGQRLDASYGANYYSTPAISQSVWLDIFRYIRIKTIASYRRMKLASYTVSGAQSASAATSDRTMHEITLRYGVEFVLPTTNRTRKKDSHLWAGVYYENAWTHYNHDGTTSSDYKGRWLLCFGK